MKSIEEMDVTVWRAVALLTAGALAVSLLTSVISGKEFPWWHLATLAIAWRMGDCSRALLAIRARAGRFIRKGYRPLARLAFRVKSAVGSINSHARIQGRLGGSPALFKRTTENAA